MEETRPFVEARRSAPGAYSDGAQAGLRGTRYGEAMVQPVGRSMQSLCSEGAYFVASNPTPGTGIAGIAAADGYDATEGLLHIHHASSSATSRICLDYILLQTTAAGTNGTTATYAMHLDTGNSRWSSGGSTLTSVNTNMASSASSPATVKFGALVMAAATASVRKVQSGTLRTVITVASDQYLFTFGREASQVGAHIVSGTAPCNVHVPCPPIELGALDQFILVVNAASQSAASSFEVTVGYWVR